MLLLDTNVVSELRKVASGKADVNVARWAAVVDPLDLYISVVTVQELEVEVLLTERRDRAQGRVLRQWLDHAVLPAFADRILPVDVAVALRSAQLHVPDPRPLHDALIAATALVHGMAIVTRNAGDLSGAGVHILNPWIAEPESRG